MDNYLQTLAQRFLADLLKGKVISEESIKEAKVREKVIQALLYDEVWTDKPPKS